MENKQENNFRFIIKTISQDIFSPFNQHYVQIDMADQRFAKGGVCITLALLKDEWTKLLKFLEKTNNPDALPPHKIAFSGYKICEDKLFYVGDNNFDTFHSIVKEQLSQISNFKKKKKIINYMSQIVNEKMEDHQKMEQGEILNKHIFLKNKNIMIVLGRENFRRFREACFSFDAKQADRTDR